jgi:hypothetical protein
MPSSQRQAGNNPTHLVLNNLRPLSWQGGNDIQQTTDQNTLRLLKRLLKMNSVHMIAAMSI